MSVQPSAVGCKPTLHIVLYCLTPPQFHRYSSLTLCSPDPAWGETNDYAQWCGNKSARGGIRLVNSCAFVRKFPLLAKPARNGAPDSLATDRWPLELMLCSN